MRLSVNVAQRCRRDSLLCDSKEALAVTSYNRHSCCVYQSVLWAGWVCWDCVPSVCMPVWCWDFCHALTITPLAPLPFCPLPTPPVSSPPPLLPCTMLYTGVWMIGQVPEWLAVQYWTLQIVVVPPLPSFNTPLLSLIFCIPVQADTLLSQFVYSQTVGGPSSWS